VLRDQDGKPVVDFELSDRLVRNTTDLGRANNGTNASAAKAEPSAPIRPVADGGRLDVVFRQAQAQERAYTAKLVELEYRERIGELVRRAVVERELSGRLVALRESLEVLADRLAALVAAESDQAVCRRLIRDEHRKALASFAEQLQQLQDAQEGDDGSA
jgi:hypothetical protein